MMIPITTTVSPRSPVRDPADQLFGMFSKWINWPIKWDVHYVGASTMGYRPIPCSIISNHSINKFGKDREK